MKVPNRPAPGVPLNRRPPQKKPETNDWPPDPFSPPRLKTDSSKEKRKAPPRPPPPRVNTNNGSNHFRSIFGSSKRNPKKGAATAIVKPMPPSSTPIIPTGTLIDLQTPPSSPKSQKCNTESIWSVSSSYKTSSTFESGFEDDFGSLLSSGATTPGTDLLSDLSPDKTEPFEVQPLKTVVSAVTSRPTIICVPKAKPARPPPPQLDGSPPMPSIPPPPPPPDLLQVLTSGPELPPRPSTQYQPKDSSATPSCTAMYDYDSTHPDDLQFKAGDVIHLIGKEGDEWLRGRLRGKEGIFPASYVSMSESSNQSLMTVIALFPFHPDSWDDLELQEGDTVTVLDRVNKDWLYGECCGRRGLFPECLVQDISYLTDEE